MMDVNIFCEIFHLGINKATKWPKFPSCVKITDVTTTYEKGSQSIKPVSILPKLSKVFERCL